MEKLRNALEAEKQDAVKKAEESARNESKKIIEGYDSETKKTEASFKKNFDKAVKNVVDELMK